MQPRGKTCFWVKNLQPKTQPKYKNNASNKSNQKSNTFEPSNSQKPKIQLQIINHKMMITVMPLHTHTLLIYSRGPVWRQLPL